MQASLVTSLFLLERLDDRLVCGEMRELVVGGGAVELSEGRELLFGCGIRDNLVEERRACREEPRGQAIREVGRDTLDGVAVQGHVPVQFGQRIDGGDGVVAVDGAGRYEEQMDQV